MKHQTITLTEEQLHYLIKAVRAIARMGRGTEREAIAWLFQNPSMLSMVSTGETKVSK